MNTSYAAFGAALVVAMLSASCAKQADGPVDKAIENTKDALDIRDHEKLKDAAESAGDAVKETGEGIKDAAKDATK